MAVASAGYNHTCTIQLLGIGGGFEHYRHFRPGQNGVIATELDAIFPNAKGAGGQSQPCGMALNCYGLKKIRIVDSARAHKFSINIAAKLVGSMRASQKY